MRAPGTLAARRHLAWWALAAVPVGFVGFLFVWPVVTVVARGLMADGGLADMGAALASARTGRVLGTTVLLAGLGTLGSVAIGLPGAYALYRLSWPGARTLRALSSVPFVLPTIVVAAAFSALLGRRGALGWLGLEQSIWAIAAALVFYNVSVITRIVGSAWAATDPSLVAAARTLGATRWQAFRQVTAPMLLPHVASAASLVFLFCASSFGIVLVLGGTRVSTIETEIYIQVNQFLNLPAVAALAALQLAVVAAALWLSDRARRIAERRTPTRRVDGSRRATRADAPALVVAVGALVVVAAAPIAALLERSVRTPEGPSLRHYAALFVPPERTVLPEPVIVSAGRSLAMAAAATAIVAVVGAVVAHLVTRRSGRATALDALLVVPLGVSSVVVGLGLLLTMNREVLGIDLRASWWLVPLGQAVVALPFLTRTLVPAARAIDPRLRAAAATLGAPPWRVWWTVDRPLLMRPFGVAVGFAGAIALGEFGATAFLARPDAPTLPTAIFRLLGRPGVDNAGMAFAASVLLAVLTGAIMVAGERLRPGGAAPGAQL